VRAPGLRSDKGGTLDLKELKRALMNLQEEARKFRSTPDPNAAKSKDLLKRAAVASEAARAVAAAEAMDDDLARLTEQLAQKADVQLGAILNKRRIKVSVQSASTASARPARHDTTRRPFLGHMPAVACCERRAVRVASAFLVAAGRGDHDLGQVAWCACGRALEGGVPRSRALSRIGLHWMHGRRH
jgi:hypothetical protein